MKIVQVSKTLPPISIGMTELGHEVVKVQLRQSEDKIIREINVLKPDLVVFHKCSDKDPEMTRAVSRRFLTWFWLADLFEVVTGERARRNIVGNARNCNFRSAPSHIPRKQLAKRTGLKVHIIPNPAPVSLGYVPAEGIEQEYDFGFLGTKTKWRQKMLSRICKGHSLLIYGGGYPNGKVNGPSWAEAVAKTRVQINLPQYSQWPATVSSRSYRILSCGGFLLSQWSKDFKDLLIPGEHFMTWDRPEEARERAVWCLQHESERKWVAEAGRRHVMENFLPIHCANKMIEIAELANFI